MSMINPKVRNAGIAGAISTLLIFVYGGVEKALGFDYPLTPEVASAITFMIMSVTGYQTAPK